MLGSVPGKASGLELRIALFGLFIDGVQVLRMSNAGEQGLQSQDAEHEVLFFWPHLHRSLKLSSL